MRRVTTTLLTGLKDASQQTCLKEYSVQRTSLSPSCLSSNITNTLTFILTLAVSSSFFFPPLHEAVQEYTKVSSSPLPQAEDYSSPVLSLLPPATGISVNDLSGP